MSLDQQTARTHELEAAVDELALQVMVSGASALTGQALGNLMTLSRSSARSTFVTKVEMASARLANNSLTDEEARALVAQMQESLKTASAAQEATDAGGNPPNQEFLGEDAELLDDFVLEANEHLTFIDGGALLLERDPSQLETVHAVFRSFHSIKGLAGFSVSRGCRPLRMRSRHCSTTHEIPAFLYLPPS